MASYYVTSTTLQTSLDTKVAKSTFTSPLTSINTGFNQSDRTAIYTQSQTDTLLITKQNTLAAATVLVGIGATLALIDKLSFSLFLWLPRERSSRESNPHCTISQLLPTPAHLSYSNTTERHNPSSTRFNQTTARFKNLMA